MGTPDGALAAHIERLDRDGYTIVEDAFDADTAEALHRDVLRLEDELGIRPAMNGFEGHATTRVYNLLAHGALYEQIPVHPVVLPLMHHLLGTGCLVSSLSSITIRPGEVAQPIHADDQLMPLRKPHTATVCNTMWAITDFTEANHPFPSASRPLLLELSERILFGSDLGITKKAAGEAIEAIVEEITKFFLRRQSNA